MPVSQIILDSLHSQNFLFTFIEDVATDDDDDLDAADEEAIIGTSLDSSDIVDALRGRLSLPFCFPDLLDITSL